MPWAGQGGLKLSIAENNGNNTGHWNYYQTLKYLINTYKIPIGQIPFTRSILAIGHLVGVLEKVINELAPRHARRCPWPRRFFVGESRSRHHHIDAGMSDRPPVALSKIVG
jgi:hypothetical protein